MTVRSWRDRACSEVTRRLLAQVVNEGLVSAVLATGGSILCLGSTQPALDGPLRRLLIAIGQDTLFRVQSDQVTTLLRPDDLILPAMLEDDAAGYITTEVDPVTIFNFISPWLASVMRQMSREKGVLHLQNSLDLQEKWLEIASTRPVLDLQSSPLAWEQSLVVGHPSHPFHKICIPQSPLIPIGPDDLPDILAPTLTFVSVLRTDVLIAGPFEATLKPLLRKLHIAEPLLDRIIVPCFHRQLPAILSRFPNAVVIRSVEQCADALSSIRTVSVKADLHYNYHIKLSLACQLTSVIRLITTGEACAAPALTELLETVRPDDLWLYREVAAVSASQSGQGQMQHLACILREDVEHRAKANNETLIVASAFIERPLDNYRTYADILFSLETEEEKFHWVRRYIAVLFSLTLPLLVQYGIGIEAHSQNMVARVCLETREIKGFVARDFSGARIHLPTLMKRRSNLPSALDIKHACLEDIREIWERTHHALLQNHVGYLLCALGLDKRGGWRVVREELEKVLNPLHCPLGRELHEYFLKETMSLKCFLSLNLDGTGRWSVNRDIPNIVIS